MNLAAAPAIAETTQEVVNKAPNGLALTPPMGWNSWNKFACNVNEQTVRETADAMVARGMRDAGYQYVVIDDCWQGRATPNGFITADPQKFPSGIKALADYVHSRGPQVRHLFGRRAADLRRPARQPGPRISGRADLCALGRRLPQIRLVQHRRPQRARKPMR